MFKPRVSYDPSTDAMMIDVSPKAAADAEEVAENVIIGYDEDNNVVSVEILNGVRKLFAPLIEAATPRQNKTPATAKKASLRVSRTARR